jgi:hypothetical protein
MSALLALTLAAALHEPPGPADFASTGYVRAPIVAADRKAETLPSAIGHWTGAAWWQALTWCADMHSVQKLRLERQGATQAQLDEQDTLSKTYMKLATDRLVADRGITADAAWDNILEAEDAYWFLFWEGRDLDYRVESMTCRLFQTRVARL